MAGAKYARPEHERRWLVPVPPDLGAARDARLIEDRYLRGTRLRLRRVTPVAGGPPEHKLGHKVRPDPADPSVVLHTTTYLTAAEHALLGLLPGAALVKVRHGLVAGGRRFAVDVFQGRHAGLVLVETELPAPGAEVAPPAFAGAEVTGDERYTGGWLAFAGDGELAAALASSESPAPAGRLLGWSGMADGLTLGDAEAVIAAARGRARDIGVRVNIAVVDGGNNLLAFARMDGALLGSIDVAMGKAYTARAFEMPTDALTALAQPGQPLYGIEASNRGRVILFGGGVPLRDGGTVLGAIGVSGGSVAQDQEVAQAGAAAFHPAGTPG